jgi:hypothetical protein
MLIQKCLPIPTCKNTPSGGEESRPPGVVDPPKNSFYETWMRYVSSEWPI